ncbi:Gfo/Idh/MocA family oxidoreductase [Termitidicoccus mucosus]|uniref:Oxidoreductase n=1 Tax=Termitidicoccus mucosus TaxID=1184151 RepID=A0A178IMC2_9BACT|nr:oxidoreductase [Opitutaceae bacterium TSB47]
MGIKIGIIGAGGMAAYHIAGFRQAGAEVVALCDPNEAVARSAAAAHGVSRVFGDAESMFAALPELNAVSVIVPNKYHAPLTLQALAAGKHVFCEKPPALNALEMAEMKGLAERNKRTLMFNFNNRARPESVAMMDYVKNGEAGRINSAQAKWVRRTGIPGFGGWFTNKVLSGGGALVDLLHMIDLSMYLMGYPEPAWVLARTFDDFITDRTFKGPWGIPDAVNGVNDVETAAHGFVSFKTGQALSFQISWAEMVQREEVSAAFQGTKAGGMLRRLYGADGVDATATDLCEFYTQDHGRSSNRVVTVESDPDMGRVRSARNFVRSIEGTESPLNTPDQALILMKIIDGAYASARSGEPVKL